MTYCTNVKQQPQKPARLLPAERPQHTHTHAEYNLSRPYKHRQQQHQQARATLCPAMHQV